MTSSNELNEVLTQNTQLKGAVKGSVLRSCLAKAMSRSCPRASWPKFAQSLESCSSRESKARFTIKVESDASSHQELMCACCFAQAGVPICRVVQKPGEMIALQPGAFYASLSLGYGTSESTCWALADWIPRGRRAARQLAHRHTPTSLCHDHLLLSVSPLLQRCRGVCLLRRPRLAAQVRCGRHLLVLHQCISASVLPILWVKTML